jgi:hypothetical protein
MELWNLRIDQRAWWIVGKLQIMEEGLLNHYLGIK